MRRCVCCLLLLLGLVSPTALALDEETAAQAAQNALKQMDDPQTTALWQEMCDAR